jgi:hypothetical protein
LASQALPEILLVFPKSLNFQRNRSGRRFNDFSLRLSTRKKTKKTTKSNILQRNLFRRREISQTAVKSFKWQTRSLSIGRDLAASGEFLNHIRRRYKKPVRSLSSSGNRSTPRENSVVDGKAFTSPARSLHRSQSRSIFGQSAQVLVKFLIPPAQSGQKTTKSLNIAAEMVMDHYKVTYLLKEKCVRFYNRKRFGRSEPVFLLNGVGNLRQQIKIL